MARPVEVCRICHLLMMVLQAHKKAAGEKERFFFRIISTTVIRCFLFLIIVP